MFEETFHECFQKWSLTLGTSISNTAEEAYNFWRLDTWDVYEQETQKSDTLRNPGKLSLCTPSVEEKYLINIVIAGRGSTAWTC